MPTCDFDNTAETSVGRVSFWMPFDSINFGLARTKISHPKLEDTHRVDGGEFIGHASNSVVFYHKRSFTLQSFNSTQSVPKIS